MGSDGDVRGVGHNDTAAYSVAHTSSKEPLDQADSVTTIPSSKSAPCQPIMLLWTLYNIKKLKRLY